jgi:hypothetical protein
MSTMDEYTMSNLYELAIPIITIGPTALGAYLINRHLNKKPEIKRPCNLDVIAKGIMGIGFVSGIVGMGLVHMFAPTYFRDLENTKQQQIEYQRTMETTRENNLDKIIIDNKQYKINGTDEVFK